MTCISATEPMSDSKIVWLSVACATTPAPTLPLAPVRFSTKTGVFKIVPKALATMRAITSDVPPGGKGTMIFKGWLGQAADCACAPIATPPRELTARFSKN